MNKLGKKQLVDGLMEAYVSWREACVQVGDTYALWTCERGMRATAAFGCYMTALDHEENAADVYATQVRRIRELAFGGHDSSVEFVAPRRRGSRR